MSLFESTLNTRDLGGKLTKSGLITIYNRIFRSDYINNLASNQHDINFLIKNKINTIIDLRSNKELENSKNDYVHLNNFKYYNFPIEEGSQIPKNISDVPKSYMEIACSKKIKNILETIANQENGVVFFCSAGKDRIGVLTTIIFMICEVFENEIVKDYMISKENLKYKLEKIANEKPNIDINVITPHESYILNFIKMFKEKFGDINTYLDNIGISDNDRNKIKNKLLI